MVLRMHENTDSVKTDERINLILDVINNLESDRIDGITDDILSELERSEVRDEDHGDFYYGLTRDEAVENGYFSYFLSYFENEDEGYDFIEKHYGSDISTFYKDLEAACKKHVSEFSDNDIDSFFESDEPMTPGDLDAWRNGYQGFRFHGRFESIKEPKKSKIYKESDEISKVKRGKKCYAVVELGKEIEDTKLIGVFYNKRDAEEVAYSQTKAWRNIIQTTIS